MCVLCMIGTVNPIITSDWRLIVERTHLPQIGRKIKVDSSEMSVLFDQIFCIALNV